MKKKALTKALAFISALAISFLSLSLLAPISASALSTRIQVDLISPITAEGTESELTPGTEAYNTIISELLSITQTAYDAFIMDNPLHEMWIDITKSGPTFTYYSAQRGNKYAYRISSLTTDLTSRPEYVDPYAMTELVREKINAFVPSGDTLYKKIESIHDFICSGTVYDATGKYAHSAYGSLVNGRSVCEGYAEAFKLICDKNGIDCILVKGVANGTGTPEAHMWNYVRMDDGRWYAIDVTWDDGSVIEDRYILVGANTEVNGSVTFAGNHFPDGDISNTNIKNFAYPTLESNSYLHNNPSGSAHQELADSRAKTYYYDQLNEEQQNYYTALKNAVPPRGSGIPSEDTTTNPPTTTPEETTTKPPTTTPEETTTQPPITTPEETTTNPPATTSKDTTTNPPETTPQNTTESREDDTATDTDTDTDTESQESLTNEDPSSELQDTLPPNGSDDTSDSESVSESDRTSETVEDGTEQSGQVGGGDQKPSTARVLRIIVIIAAILSLFGLVAIIIIRSTSH